MRETHRFGLSYPPNKDETCLNISHPIKTYIILILLHFEVAVLIPLPVTEYGADADRREGDLSIYAYRSSPFQYKMTLFVQECDQLSPAHHVKLET